ncbi:phosphoglycerate dehydrogenase [Bremerella sp. JC817]|uniref:phosphoglycerate dehydrogenase n=1 Tax=Bremerella sp. JC817 TaxID=3231756 RepID=UPI00345B4692
MPTACVTAPHYHQPKHDYYDILTRAGFEVRFIDPKQHDLSDADTLLAQLDGAEVTMCSMEPYTPEVMSRSNLRVICRFGVGFDAIDVSGATAENIVVCRTTGVLQHSVAEQTLALLFGVMRDVVRRDRAVREGKWSQPPLPRLHGKTIGLLGLGSTGRCVADKALGLGMKVIAYSPSGRPSPGVEMVSLEQLWRDSDVLSIHAPLIPETRNIVNADTLAKMKPGSVLINTGRGGHVDEAALVEALKSGHLLGAGLDVFQEEPTPADNPLLKLDNVVAAPHIAGGDHEALYDIPVLAAQNVVDLYEGRWPAENIVNAEVRPTWKW